MNLQRSNDEVSICNDNKCIHAKGKNANLIAAGTFVMFLMIGISALVKSN